MAILIDVAASEFLTKCGKYNLHFKDGRIDPTLWLSSDKLSDLYGSLISKYPIISIEDPFDQDDWASWIKFSSRSRIQVGPYKDLHLCFPFILLSS
ncbi:unnamed protein product [Protopolystoma xenopodis]|uniref:phosphopyruvate hydratase n=1 Tax=Protopolystoma xenopodis TaxID=117903 RepID=A0A3S5APM7_9PLAT|nr:unnamed protein product [Protopolystoma xenopodis]